MRILFVEDEEDKLVSTITEVFSPARNEIGHNPLLRELDEKIKQINTFVGDAYDCREDIKKIFSDCPFLNVEYDFLDALKLIESEDVRKYDLFILDRNLRAKERGLTEEEFKNASPDSTADDYSYICNQGDFGREGDYLLMRLHARFRDDLRSRFCFYSGYPDDEVFKNNRFLKDNIGEGNLISKNDYIKKGDIDGLRDFVHRDYEAVQIYKKWGKVLCYYDDRVKDGYIIRRTLVSALKTGFVAGSKMMNTTEAKKAYYDTLDLFWNYYKEYFFKTFSKQLKELSNAKRKYLGEQNSTKRDENSVEKFIDKWYLTAKIPRNIVDIADVLRRNRNYGEHFIEYKNKDNLNVDMSGLTVLVCAYALLEITRFWQDNNMDEWLKEQPE